MKALFYGKHAVNRAAHAAAQQLDPEALGDGIFRIAPEAAAETAARYLQVNLRVDASGAPLAGSALKEPVEVVVFEIINADETFPYTYRNNDYQYEVILHRPGVVLIALIRYPRAFELMEDIEWYIKGAAEVTAG
ncbi:hypothetical protein D3C78_872540 [compost metagenome]